MDFVSVKTWLLISCDTGIYAIILGIFVSHNNIGILCLFKYLTLISLYLHQHILCANEANIDAIMRYPTIYRLSFIRT